MGRSGTAVAREAAAMVLLDDHFATIVAAIREGRAVYDNVRKFITYIFASNVPEIVPFVAFVLFGIPLPLTVLQILAVDLGTDLLPALALGREPAEPDVMERPPRRRTERLLDASVLLRAYGWLGSIEAALSLGAFFFAYWLEGWRPGGELARQGALYARATTATFAAIVACQVGNVFACRSERAWLVQLGLLSNPLLLFAVGVEVALLALFVYWEPLARLFGFAPLLPAQWAALTVFPLLLLGAEEARKQVLRAAGLRSPRRTSAT
jgi:magnesium-transporting ATPase (P-type)